MMTRAQVTEEIQRKKVLKGILWTDVARQLGDDYSPVWSTAACLGQMRMSKTEANCVDRIFDMNGMAVPWLQTVSYKSTKEIPSDPLLYRFYEVLGIYGPAIKELIHEDFGDGIMSAVDFNLDLNRKPGSDRIVMTWSGKYLPYKKF